MLDVHDMEQAEEFECDTIEIICNITFSSSSYKDHTTCNGNAMFNKIALLDCFGGDKLMIG